MLDSKKFEKKAFKIGHLEVDLQRGSVESSLGTEQLSPRAERLLLLLCRNPNVVVTREQILEEVWAGRVVEDAAITHCVWQIRRHLGEDGRRILQTKPKRGYSLRLSSSQEPAVGEGCAGDAPEPSHLAPANLAVSTAQLDSDARDSVMSAAKSEASAATKATTRYRSAIAGALAIIGILIALQIWRYLWPQRIDLPPGGEITVSLILPKSMASLDDAIERVMAESAYRRGAGALLFENGMTASAFGSPHFQLRAKSMGDNTISAEFLLSRGDLRFREEYEGSAERLHIAVERFLDARLTKPIRSISADTEPMVSALLAEMRYERIKAVTEYRRALARRPGSTEAIVGIAGVLLKLGRQREALAWLAGLPPSEKLDSKVRCQRDFILVELAPERVGPEPCSAVASWISHQEGDLRSSLRSAERAPPKSKNISQWIEDEARAIEALIMLGEHESAESRIARGAAVARRAGWEYGAVGIESLRALLLVYRGKMEESVEAHRQTSDRYRSLGDSDEAGLHRILSLRPIPPEPGDAVQVQRRLLESILAQARTSANVGNEIEALQVLISLDRDELARWQRHLSRLSVLIATHNGPRARQQNEMFVLDEIRAQRRYREVTNKIQNSERQDGALDANVKLWRLLLLAESEFALDRLDMAMRAVDAMEKENFQIAATGSACLFAWLYAEAGYADRTKLLLDACEGEEYDRTARAARADFALLARARLQVMEGDSAGAWSVIAPRIDELSSFQTLSRREAESLTLLARHATAMPGADRARLRQALRITAAISERDGAGPSLRLGVHLLRWRLCRAETVGDCGPLLPSWAPEDRFEARKALEATANSVH